MAAKLRGAWSAAKVGVVPALPCLANVRVGLPVACGGVLPLSPAHDVVRRIRPRVSVHGHLIRCTCYRDGAFPPGLCPSLAVGGKKIREFDKDI